MDYSLKEWIALSEGKTLAEAAITAQVNETHVAREDVVAMMRHQLGCMKEAVQSGLDENLRSVSGLTGGQAAYLYRYYLSGKSLCGPLLGKAEAYALATAECNACMGKIVAAPTAGACGIIPGTLLAMMEEKGITEDEVVNALFVAAAIGQSIAVAASIAGAEGGCQAECGAAAAMAAGALVYLQGGTAKQSVDAACFAIMNLLGLVCDPVGGLVEVPCVYRNVGSCGIAFTSADMVLSGIPCPIDPDEVLSAMKDVGDALPASLRETGEGGCASCESICAKLKHKHPGTN